MQFESRQKRDYWINALYGLIPDSIIAIAISYFTQSGIIGFIFAIIGLQCVYFAIWLKNSIWRWVFFKFRGKQLMVEHIEGFLKESKFPAPNKLENSVEGYLVSIMENEDLETKTRIKAAGEIGALNYVNALQMVQESLRLNMSYEEALLNYEKYLNENNS